MGKFVHKQCVHKHDKCRKDMWVSVYTSSMYTSMTSVGRTACFGHHARVFLNIWHCYIQTTIPVQKWSSTQLKKKTNYAGSENHSPHQFRKNSHFSTRHCNAPPPQRIRKSNGDQEGCRLDLKPASNEIWYRTGKCASGMDKFGSIVKTHT